MNRRLLLVLLSAFLVLGAACGESDETEAGGDTEQTESETPETETSETPTDGTVTIKAIDFAFEAPGTLPAGETDIVFENTGKEPHELVMVPLAEGAPPVTELIELPEKKAEEYFAGKPISSHGPIKPGETTDLSADLKPGTYGMVCFVVSKTEKQPHAFLGMVNSLIVE